MNKRDFLFSGVAAASLAPATLPALAQSPARAFPDLASGYSAERFEAFVGETFQTADGPLTLKVVERLKIDGPAEQFNLHFGAPAAERAATGLQTLQHAGSDQALVLHLEPGLNGTVQANFSLLA